MQSQQVDQPQRLSNPNIHLIQSDSDDQQDNQFAKIQHQQSTHETTAYQQTQIYQQLKKYHHVEIQPNDQQNKQTDFVNLLEDKKIAEKTSEQRDFEKQFQEMNFISNQFNLMDLDMCQAAEDDSEVSHLSGYAYQKFVQNRSIHIQPPVLINQGYITSYKLYVIKSRGSTSISYDTCVSRRFSDFQYLNQQLIQLYGGYIIPLLPQKNFWASINLQGKDYKEVRTKMLVKYLYRLLKHHKIRLTEQVREFLFMDDVMFSASKGQFTQKKLNIEQKIKNISTGAFQYGKFFYNKIIQLSTGQKQIKNLTTNQQDFLMKGGNNSQIKMTKQSLNLSQYKIVIGDFMRVTKQLKILVQNTIQQIKRIQQLNRLFSLQQMSIKPSSISKSSSSTYPSASQSMLIKIQNDNLFQQYQQLSSFIQSCASAILRHDMLQQQILVLTQQQQQFLLKNKNANRNYQLDDIRAKLNRLRKMSRNHTKDLIQELRIHADQGKGMLKGFVEKFTQIKVDFFNNNNYFE